MPTAIIPIPRSPVTVRPATAADLPFIDSLQKLHAKQVGWMPTKQLVQKITLGHVLVAEMRNDECRMQNVDEAGSAVPPASPFGIHHSAFSISPVGYCVGHDQYFKRDDVGIIY